MFKVQAFSTTQLSLLQLRHDDGRDDKDWGREEEAGPSSLNNGLGGDRIGNGKGKFELHKSVHTSTFTKSCNYSQINQWEYVYCTQHSLRSHDTGPCPR